MRFRISTTLVLLFCLTAVGSAQVNSGGYLKLFSHLNLNKPYPYDRLGSRLQLTFSRALGSRAFLFSAVDFNYEETRASGAADEPRSAGMEVYPVETYIDLYFSALDLRLGKQFIFWGRTDWINPTDNINPWDYQNIAAEIEDYRIPVMAAKADLYIGNWTIEGVWLPRFTPDKIPITPPNSMGNLPVRLLPSERPENKIANSELAVRVLSHTGRFDYSLSYFRGFRKKPDIDMRMTMEDPSNPSSAYMAWTPIYHRVHIFGGDFVGTFGRWAVKGEAAYFLTDDRAGTDVFIENPYLYYVLGADHNFSDDVSLTLQFSQKIRFKYDVKREFSTLKMMGDPHPVVPDKYQNSVSTRLNYRLFKFTGLQLIGVMNLKDQDFFLLPILTHELADGLNLYGGATIFGGPARSPFGRSKAYSRFFAEIKFSF